MRWTRAGHDHGRARLLPAAALRSPDRSRRRTLGLLGIAGISVTATVGFGAAAMASPSPGTSGSIPDTPSTTTATVALTNLTGSTVKSGGTVKYTVAVSQIKNAPISAAKLTLTGGAVTWTNCGGNTVQGQTCTLGDIAKDASASATLTTAKYKKDTHITVSAALTGTGSDKNALAELHSNANTVLVKKVPVATPTPTKTAKPTPTKTKKPSPHPTKSHSHKPATSHHHSTPSTPSDNGHVPIPTTLPTGGIPTDLPSVPNGSQSPFPFGNNPTSTGVPVLPSVAPSPDGPVRTPNVADPQKKATGLVRSDAVSVPAAAAAAFLGLGAGTLITRAVRRRGLWHPIGRHRD